MILIQDQQSQLLDMLTKKKMETNALLKLHHDIQRLVNEKPRPVVKKRQKSLPVFERVNDDVPLLTEEKLEEAYMSKTISHKTKKLLEWLLVRENIEQAQNDFEHNQAKFEEISFLLETEKVNFTTFIRKLIQKHEQAIFT